VLTFIACNFDGENRSPLVSIFYEKFVKKLVLALYLVTCDWNGWDSTRFGPAVFLWLSVSPVN
jgi:hypothetical protein